MRNLKHADSSCRFGFNEILTVTLLEALHHPYTYMHTLGMQNIYFSKALSCRERYTNFPSELW